MLEKVNGFSKSHFAKKCFQCIQQILKEIDVPTLSNSEPVAA